jgi:hypothetical protein
VVDEGPWPLSGRGWPGTRRPGSSALLVFNDLPHGTGQDRQVPGQGQLALIEPSAPVDYSLDAYREAAVAVSMGG